MKRRARLLMGICASVFAIVGGSASLASAAPLLEAGAYPAVVEANQTPGNELTFDIGGQKASCEKAELVGVIAEPEASIVMGPIFTGCKAFGFLNATISGGGCDLILTPGDSPQANHHRATVDLRCLGESRMTIKASTCEVQIGGQEDLGEFELINNPLSKPRKTVTLVSDIENLAYTTTKDGFLCPLAGAGSFNNGTITAIQNMAAQAGGDGLTKLNFAVNDEPPPQPLFESAEYPAIVEANQVPGNELTFDLGGQKASCEIAEFNGVIAEPEASIVMGPIFTGCKAFGFLNATISGGGCDLILTPGEEFQAIHHRASAELRCFGESRMTIKASTCEVQIGGQQGLGEFELINNPGSFPGKTVKLVSNVQRLAYTTTKDGFLCPLAEVGSFNDGKINGTQIMVAEEGVTERKFDFSVSTEPPPPPALEAGQYAAALKGVQGPSTLVFAIEGNNVTCKVASVSGSLSGPTSFVTLHPTFSECTAFGFVNSTVDTTGCDLVFRVGEETRAHRHSATLDLACSGSNKILIKANTCEVEIPSQQNLGKVELVDNAEASPKRNVSIRYTVSKIAATALKDGFLCGINGVGPKSATLSGIHTLTAEKPGDPTQPFDLSVSAELPPTSFVEAGQYAAALKGVQGPTLVLSVEGNNVTCETAALSGSLAGPSSILTLHPIHSGCTVFGFLESSVETTGCDFVVRVGEEVNLHRHNASLDIACSGSNKIRMANAFCEVEIPSQQNLGKIELVDNPEASPRKSVSIRYSVTKIAVNTLKDGPICPLNGVGSRTASLSGAHTLTAEAPSDPTRPFNLSVSEG